MADIIKDVTESMSEGKDGQCEGTQAHQDIKRSMYRRVLKVVVTATLIASYCIGIFLLISMIG